MAKKKEKSCECSSAEMSFSIADVSTIMEMLRANDVYEFCLERGNDKLWLKRTPEVNVVASAPLPTAVAPLIGQQVVAPVEQARDVLREVAPGKVEQREEVVEIPASKPTVNYHEIISPMVGTFYSRPAVDADPYVQVGDLVKKGDVLCIIEAMKIMNEIEADVSGRVAEIYVEDGQMAEYGEVLVRIEKAA
ncbi:MAG: acetyl-CoA carboxylase biotin carboxyl carrier protein [Deltaproteobacteria bacterium]|nr:acetyl-CoA carboxylase biotin carboxyl carrier protein [Deltaproteobacteria bacterium]